VRIIGGEAKGRIIQLPQGCRIRPTTDRIKESLFSLLRTVRDTRFLDLFAGCGNVGLEAISRGACRSLFVEKSPRLAAVIKSNLGLLGFEDRGEILAIDAEKAIRLLECRRDRFDIIFADPPYEADCVTAILQQIAEADLLATEGVTVLQRSVREAIPTEPVGRLVLMDQRRYGDTWLSFFGRRG
jgi:16S rRNA (guanine(966)-N(2))-methyltransferase RsmD